MDELKEAKVVLFDTCLHKFEMDLGRIAPASEVTVEDALPF
jgi:hypothetical protein